MDKASSPHYKSKKIKYFEQNKDTLNQVYLPTTASPEFMVMMEEIWNIVLCCMIHENLQYHKIFCLNRYHFVIP